MPDRKSSNRTIFSVSELNQSVAQLIEKEFAWIWVEGEISNLAKPASGHIYFTLKDAKAQLRCAMFRGNNRSLRFTTKSGKPENGIQVQIRGKVSLYQPRGDYQLIVDRMEEAGAGDLQRRFEALKHQLAKEGLFDDDVKLPVPELPEAIGVITSGSGAAIRDVLSVIERRFPSIPVYLYPVPVQGAQAAPAICKALKLAEKHAECDVLLLVRGGGSLEDLWSFNEESVARAVYDCYLPIVSGVGHEVDVTIVDYVADLRAATPTAAAEAVTPDQRGWLDSLTGYQQRLFQLIQSRIARQQEKLQWISKRLSQQHPSTVLEGYNQRLDDLDQRLKTGWQLNYAEYRHQLVQAFSRLQAHSPDKAISQLKSRLGLLYQRINHAIHSQQSTNRARLENSVSTLNALSPLNTLARGYSITSDQNGQTLIDSKQIKVDTKVHTRLKKGSFISSIEKITNN